MRALRRGQQEVLGRQVRNRHLLQANRAAVVGAQVHNRRRPVRRQRQRREVAGSREREQVDLVCLLGAEVGNRVRAVTGGEHERVGPRAARQRARPAVQHVVAPAPIECVVPRLAVEFVVVRVAVLAIQDVVARATLQRVGAVSSAQGVGGGGAGH